MIKFSIKKIHWLDILLIVFSIFTAFQLILLNKVMLAGFIYPCTQYNNYVIFIESFKHLIQGTNLYQLYPLEYCDYYKYSPTFAAGMFIFLLFTNTHWINYMEFNKLLAFMACF